MSDGLAGFICGLVVGTVFTLIACGIRSECQDNWWRDELARRGVAHYYLDENNWRQWNWKETK